MLNASMEGRKTVRELAGARCWHAVFDVQTVKSLALRVFKPLRKYHGPSKHPRHSWLKVGPNVFFKARSGRRPRL